MLFRLLLLSVCLTLSTLAFAQAETFATQTLPNGWYHANPPLQWGPRWHIDGGPTTTPWDPWAPSTSGIPMTPYHSPPYSLNYNRGGNYANGGKAHEGGVFTKVYDLTNAPNPILTFWQMQQRKDKRRLFFGQAHVRVWDEFQTTAYLMVDLTYLGGGLSPWTQEVIQLNNDWGRVRIEFFFDGSYDYTPYTGSSAGWFIDDVEVTGLSQTTMIINTPRDLPTLSAGTNANVQLTCTNGTQPYLNWQVVGGTLPNGVTLNPNTGMLEGTASMDSAGKYIFKIGADDSASLHDTKTFHWTVTRPSAFNYATQPMPYSETFASDTGWVYGTGNASTYSDQSQGGWETGATRRSVPAGFHFDYGDPATDHSVGEDNFVLGVGLGEAHPSNVSKHTIYWAYSPEIEVGGIRNLEIRFWSQTNQHRLLVFFFVEIFNPITSTWQSTGTYTPSHVGEEYWTEKISPFDFGAVPASNATTRVRFGWNVTDDKYRNDLRGGGVNIDDLTIQETPQPGIVTMTELEVVSTQQAGSTSKVYVGANHEVKLSVTNNSPHPVHVHTFRHRWFVGQVDENVALVNLSATPSGTNPWIIPANAVNFDISDGNGGGAYPITATFTHPPNAGSGGTVIWHVELWGKEQGGANRGTGSDSTIDGTPDELVSIFTQPGLTISDPANLPDASEGVLYSYTFTAQFGTAPYVNWQMISGPSWLSFDAGQHRIYGTPPSGSAPNNVQVTIKVEDSANPTPATDTRVFDIAIVNSGPGPLRITTPSQLPNATRGMPVAPVSFNAAGGTPPYTWSTNLTWLAAPTGSGTCMGMQWSSATAELSGTPTSFAGVYAFELSVTDSASVTTASTFYLVVLPQNPTVGIDTPTTGINAPPHALENTPYSFQFQALGGYQINGGYLWAVVAGEIPPGLVLNSTTGELDGVPNVPGNFYFTVRASDGAFPPGTDSQNYYIHVGAIVPTPLQFDTLSFLPDGAEGNQYSTTFSASSGITPYSWRLALQPNEQLPPGLFLDTQVGLLDGLLLPGNATAPGQVYAFTIEVSDSSTPPQATLKQFTLDVEAFVAGPLAASTPTTLPQGGVGYPYSSWLRASGGSPLDPANPYLWTVANGSTLPNGLTLSAGGLIEGVPGIHTAGVHAFSVEVSDGSGNTIAATFDLQINGHAVDPNAPEATVLEYGDRRTESVPLWNACSAVSNRAYGSLLGLLGLMCFAWYRRKRAA